jgi:hypothetical protein
LVVFRQRCLAFNEVAVQGQLADGGIDLAKGKGGTPFKPTSSEPVGVGGEPGLKRSGSGIVGERGAVFVRQAGQAHQAAD